MKKLLLLGGSRYLLPVIEAAKKLGIYTITCDYLPENMAHKYSDCYRNVSIIDKDAVLDAARELEVDGVMSFACDPGVVTAAYVADRMGLPAAGPYDSVCILQNKGRFRRFLAEHGFNVPFAKEYTSSADAMNDADSLTFPVIVKPTDSAGSKGVTRVDSADALPSAIDHALTFSLSGEFIIEEFIEKRGFSSDSDCFSVDGELKFVSFSAQRFDEDAAGPYTPAAYSWPSSISPENEETLKCEIGRLLRLLGMGTSIYNVEVRESTAGIPYIMEVSPRGGGNRLAEMLRYATGVDLIENAVRAAVGMETVGVEQKPYLGNLAEIILHSNSAGVFSHLEVSEEIRECVVEEDLWVSDGDHIGAFTAANEAIGTLVLRFDDAEMLRTVMENVSDYVKVVLK